MKVEHWHFPFQSHLLSSIIISLKLHCTLVTHTSVHYAYASLKNHPNQTLLINPLGKIIPIEHMFNTLYSFLLSPWVI